MDPRIKFKDDGRGDFFIRTLMGLRRYVDKQEML